MKLTPERKRQVAQLPNVAVVVEDLVLLVVGDKVLLDQRVINDRRLDGLLVLLDLALLLELLLDVLLHPYFYN